MAVKVLQPEKISNDVEYHIGNEESPEISPELFSDGFRFFREVTGDHEKKRKVKCIDEIVELNILKMKVAEDYEINTDGFCIIDPVFSFLHRQTPEIQNTAIDEQGMSEW
jgi:hypothetical protein